MSDAKFEVFTAMKNLVVVFRVVTQCSDVVRYQRFGRPRSLHAQGEVEGSMVQKYTYKLIPVLT
jgi:hypothetical protein